MEREREGGDAGCCWAQMCVCVGSWGSDMDFCTCKSGFVRFPSVFVSDSEMRVQSAEQRALKAEEALQSALVKIQDLESHLQGGSSLIAEGTELQTWN